jgi:hypothetical protein
MTKLQQLLKRRLRKPHRTKDASRKDTHDKDEEVSTETLPHTTSWASGSDHHDEVEAREPAPPPHQLRLLTSSDSSASTSKPHNTNNKSAAQPQDCNDTPNPKLQKKTDDIMFIQTDEALT